MPDLLVKFKNKIHLAFSRLAKGTPPAYEEDGEPLSSSELHAIQKAAAPLLPKGHVVKKRTLL